MNILACHNCGADVAGEALFRGVSFRLEAGEKVGLIGPNGAGKTTLLKACLGQWPLESGVASLRGSYGYLPQTPTLADTGTVYDCLLQERSDLLELRARLNDLEAAMAGDPEARIFEQYGRLIEEYERSGGYALEAQVRKILAGLGLAEESSVLVSKLSGGQKTRLALAKLLLCAPQLLVLDEPTNHLDLAALEWLENFLRDYDGAVIVVSHDRYFLDRVVSKIFCLEAGTLKVYPGNFSEYELLRANEEKTLAREAERMAKKIARLEEYIRRNKAGVNARQARGRETQLRKLQPAARGANNRDLSISLGSAERSGERVLLVENLTVSFGVRELFRGVTFELRRGDKVAVLGRNGVGKTTLLKAILQQVAYRGFIDLGANVRAAYYAQEHEDLDLTSTVIDEIRRASKLLDPQIRNLLARYGFRGEDVFKPVRVLSGGEKSRLALCKLFLTSGNLLLLDEPTNHLDTLTRELLEEALEDYPGTALIVSHDRYFLDKVVTKVAELSPAGLNLFPGNYTEFRELQRLRRSEPLPAEETEASKQDMARREAERAGGFTRQELKEERRRHKLLQNLEERITALEMQLSRLEEELAACASDYSQACKLHQAWEQTRADLADAWATWEQIAE